jgi:hypothetical protein
MIEAPYSELDYSSEYLEDNRGEESLDFNNEDLLQEDAK